MGVQINQLSTTTPGAGQSVPVYDPSKGDARRWSLSDLLAWMQANLVFPAPFGRMEPNTQYSAPNDGDTVVVADDDDDTHLIITPALGLAALTITLPAFGTARNKQIVIINCTQAIAALTVDGNGATVGTGTPGILGADDFFTLKYDDIMNTWYRIG
jgi:hypothetical protein